MPSPRPESPSLDSDSENEQAPATNTVSSEERRRRQRVRELKGALKEVNAQLEEVDTQFKMAMVATAGAGLFTGGIGWLVLGGSVGSTKLADKRELIVKRRDRLVEELEELDGIRQPSYTFFTVPSLEQMKQSTVGAVANIQKQGSQVISGGKTVIKKGGELLGRRQQDEEMPESPAPSAP